MHLVAILIISALFSLIQIFKIKKNRFAQVIHIAFSLSIGICLVPNQVIAMDGYYLLGMSGLLVIFYAIHNEEHPLNKRIILGVMALIHLLAIGAFVMAWPSSIYFYVAGVIPIGLFLFALIKDVKSYKNEIGFMSVMMAVGLVNVIIAATIFFGE